VVIFEGDTIKIHTELELKIAPKKEIKKLSTNPSSQPQNALIPYVLK
jgi:hypothetical protein